MANQILTNAYASANVGTGEYVLLGTTEIDTSKIMVSDNSNQIVKLAVAKKLSSAIPATFAELNLQQILFKARASGTGGNSITVAFADPGTDNTPISVEVATNAITVNLATSDGDQASVVIQDLTYTAKEFGVAGDDITIEYVDPEGNDEPLSVSVVGDAIEVSLETDSGGLIVSTAEDVLEAIEADVDANALVSVSISGTASDVQEAQVATNLEGGADYGLVSTLQDVINAIGAFAAASALVTARINGDYNSSTLATTVGNTNLAGGVAVGSDFAAIEDLFQCPLNSFTQYSLGSINIVPRGSRLYLRAISATANSGFNCTTIVA